MNTTGSRTLAEVALRFYDQPDIRRIEDALVHVASQVVDVDDVGVLAQRPGGSVEPGASTGPRVTKIHQLQLMLAEGPGLQCLGDAEPLLVNDIGSETRWPEWTMRASALDRRSAIVVALGMPDRTFGVLGLYSARVDAFDADDVEICTALARHASVALATARTEGRLRKAIDVRHSIGQAQGMLMERHGIDAQQAFEILRKRAEEHGVKLGEVAERVTGTSTVRAN